MNNITSFHSTTTGLQWIMTYIQVVVRVVRIRRRTVDEVESRVVVVGGRGWRRFDFNQRFLNGRQLGGRIQCGCLGQIGQCLAVSLDGLGEVGGVTVEAGSGRGCVPCDNSAIWTVWNDLRVLNIEEEESAIGH